MVVSALRGDATTALKVVDGNGEVAPVARSAHGAWALIPSAILEPFNTPPSGSDDHSSEAASSAASQHSLTRLFLLSYIQVWRITDMTR
jgi:hypothetical protein